MVYISGDDNATNVPEAKFYSLLDQADKGERTLFSMPAGRNKLGIVSRNRGVLRFVKYVNRRAKGDRWDICGKYSVVTQNNDGNTVIAEVTILIILRWRQTKTRLPMTTEAIFTDNEICG